MRKERKAEFKEPNGGKQTKRGEEQNKGPRSDKLQKLRPLVAWGGNCRRAFWFDLWLLPESGGRYMLCLLFLWYQQKTELRVLQNCQPSKQYHHI